MHARKSGPDLLKLVGFLAQRAEDLQMMNLVSGASLIFLFQVHRSDITVSSR
jgi:hypothetical protein